MKQKIGDFFVSYFFHFILRLRVLHAGIRILLDFYVVGFSTFDEALGCLVLPIPH